MRTITDGPAMQREADFCRRDGKTVAVVPTMGALHRGHLELIRAARAAADVVVVTLFVNPTQFGKGEDFERYPRDAAGDALRVAEAGGHILFAPTVEGIYGPRHQTHVAVEDVTRRLEGEVRPGHFQGVATVVTKLFHLTKPHLAFFGQKDAQQVAVITRMIRDLDFDVRLVILPTVREEDGLAMSSRNVYLDTAQRREAPVLYRSLRSGEEMIMRGERSAAVVVGEITRRIATETSGRIDYVSAADGETLEERTAFVPGEKVLLSLAVRFGTTRLIDNIPVTIPYG
jgi:pantoate--beta-alanine ligase